MSDYNIIHCKKCQMEFHTYTDTLEIPEHECLSEKNGN